MIERQDILGVSVSALDLDTAVRRIGGWIQARDPNYVCVTPAHGVMDARLDPELLEIFNSSGMTTPDGMSIVWILRLMGHRNVSRVYGPDLMIATCEAGIEKGWRHFLYGGDTRENMAWQLLLLVGQTREVRRCLSQRIRGQHES